ncbi:MAG: hypothetical protein C0183_23080 [Roseiflexus castenholzii]|jgi:hypothetical protein|uniref:Lipoprotein n=1 Tax=Roseiflexus castenholzii (strain DSM 13941 / HLO8) TaxID=383372 RepID=A7NKA2_ROSCS|nr:hypothetical protein [Roseiflexus castenholzii]ABU57922.1 conserved hypothetical protein [Roseiflexus castenholzii DSM 13941]PMP73311.1 MAG: hypothetical protein C0183_23080 [Roseiflexus castenholzii]
MISRFLALTLLAFLVAACGSAPLAEPPVYPDATAASQGESPLADAMVSGLTAEIVGEQQASAIRLFRVPGSIAWEQVKQFYAGRLESSGWRADGRLLVEGDTISYAAWRNGDQLLALAHTEDASTGATYLAVAVLRR